MDAQLKKGVLELCLLQCLSGEPKYGYDVIQTMRDCFPDVTEDTFYAILRRLGAEEKQMERSATQQVALAFLLPLVLALVHSVVGMKAANEIIATAGRVDSAASSAVTAGVLLIVYGGYFLATSLACRRMAKNA